jgi:F-type H+-transporting ATPase subunit epsilon
MCRHEGAGFVAMRLLISDPTTLVVDEPNVVSVRAEDESGGFGILPGHADLLTVLIPSAVSWRREDGSTHWCAVRRGVLTVSGGREVAIATRQALLGDDLPEVEAEVLARFRADADAEQAALVAATRLHMDAIRQIVRALRPGQRYGAEP